jgi:hypothetical protein
VREVPIQVAIPGEVISSVLMHFRNGQIGEAVSRFADEFTFRDHGVGLEFTDKARLTEFFHKLRELYPDSLLIADTAFTCGEHVIVKWTCQATITEPFYGGLSRKVPVSVQGASIVRTHEGEITDWADYYDGLTSRRTALASHFQEWVEL